MPKLMLFHCANAVTLVSNLAVDIAEVRTVKLPCSSMIKDFILLRAFEAGSDAVIILTCPDGQCRYIDGNIRAQKRVERVKKMLDAIGLDSRRLMLFNALPEGGGIKEIVRQALFRLEYLGPSPITSPVIALTR